MKRIISASILTIFILSCNNPIKNADIIFQSQIDATLGENIKVFSSTAGFVNYGDPSNYWYSEETTYKEILNDKYQLGFQKLKKLDTDIESIDCSNEQINHAILELHKEIEIAKDEIKASRKALESMNGLFGLMAIGGTNGFLALSDVFLSSDEREKNEEKGRNMPENVKTKLAILNREIILSYHDFAENMNTLLNKAVKNSQPSSSEKEKIKENLKSLVQQHINSSYNSTDISSRDNMLKMIFNYFEENKVTENVNRDGNDLPKQPEVIIESDTSPASQSNNIGYFMVRAGDSNLVHFYSKADSNTQRKAYFSSRDKVYVSKTENGFGYVEFTNPKGILSKGWIKLDYLDNYNDSEK